MLYSLSKQRDGFPIVLLPPISENHHSKTTEEAIPTLLTEGLSMAHIFIRITSTLIEARISQNTFNHTLSHSAKLNLTAFWFLPILELSLTLTPISLKPVGLRRTIRLKFSQTSTILLELWKLKPPSWLKYKNLEENGDRKLPARPKTMNDCLTKWFPSFYSKNYYYYLKMIKMIKIEKFSSLTSIMTQPHRF